MSDFLIEDIKPEMLHAIEERARKSGRSIEQEAEWLIRRGLDVEQTDFKLTTSFQGLLEPQ